MSDGAPSARELFERAAALEGEARRRLLDGSRSFAPEVVLEVESLLAYHERAGALLDRSPLESGAGEEGGADGPPPMPERLGNYTILRTIGSGGMGVVYEARQDSPRRTVALKVIRPGLVSPGLLKRFTLEAAALGRLQHPGIAQVYEAGTVLPEGGREGRAIPFISMELVAGEPLTEHARRSALGTRERLELFMKVCDAVEHAHQRAVVHRDLKPGNILVTAEGQPKVLDFGVARLTDSEARVTTISTSMGQILGTLSYMSPEQAAGDPAAIDSRADVYALGVLLYELLSGRLPIDPGNSPVHEALRAIATDEPRTLSFFDRRLRGDLETIARRALEKDKSRRYAGAAELAADVRRYLADQPIAARPPSALYQLSKFARRNRAVVVGVAAVFLTLVVGIIAASWQAARAREQALRARETAAFLQRMIRSATPEVARGKDTTIREMLETAERDLALDGSMHPSVRADAHRMFAEAHAKLGDFRPAEAHARRAMAVYEEHLGPGRPESLTALGVLVTVLCETDRAEEALALARRGWEIADRHLSEGHELRRNMASVVAQALGWQASPDREEVLGWRRLACELDERVLGAEHRETLIEYSNLGIELMEAGRVGEAEPVFARVLEARRRTLGEDHPDTLIALNNSAAAFTRRGDFGGALPILESLVERSRRVFGPTHPSTLTFLRNLAVAYFQLGRIAEAEPIARASYEGGVARLGPDHSETFGALGMWANALVQLKRLDEAEPLVRRLREGTRRVFGEGHPVAVQAITAEYDLAEARGDLTGMRRAAEALRGTEYEQAVFEQLKKHEETAGSAGPG